MSDASNRWFLKMGNDMGTRMAKAVGDAAESIAKSAMWASATRLGVPVLLALFIVGIPSALSWASWVDLQIMVVKIETQNMAVALKDLKEQTRDAVAKDNAMREDMAAVKATLAQLMRGVDRIQTRVDQLK